MCLARVKFTPKGESDPVGGLTDVSYIEHTAAGLRITDLVGVVTELDAEIRTIDFIDSVVTVERAGEMPRHGTGTEGQ